MDKALTLLVIDDNRDDRDLYQKLLKAAWGDELHLFESAGGESGIAFLEKETPQCVLLDYSLPGHNGIEVLKRIRVKHPFLPVIMLTGQGNEAVAVQSMKEGAQDYVVKATVTSETLERVIRTAIENSALQKRIDQQRTSLEIFTRALAHDLKEPVRTIRSFIEQITDWQNLSEESQESFHYISRAANRMNALIDAVHLYTRLDAAEKMEKGPCDLAKILEEAQENLVQLIQERGAVITYDTLPHLAANRVQIMQLFQNLLSNSIKHSEKAVAVHVSADEYQDYWQINVRDNGPGIAPEHLEIIFAPFKRMSRRREYEGGLGLGLAINRKIVEYHNGKIWCESQPGAGSVFCFTIPKTESSILEESNFSGNGLQFDKKQTANSGESVARLLLVDDNEVDLELYRRLMKKSKLRCDTVAACDGQEALNALRKAQQEGNPIDLILLDINMPGMDGFEFLTHMQKEEDFSKTMVVICSTSDYDMDKKKAASFGVAGYLTKPPQLSSLKEIVDRSARLRWNSEGDGYTLVKTA